MAQASRNLRKTRRLKRERTLSLRFAQAALAQRDEARLIAQAAIKELENLTEKKLEDKKKDFEINVIQEENVETNQAVGPNPDGAGLEVPTV